MLSLTISKLHILALLTPAAQGVALNRIWGSLPSDAVAVSQYLNSFSIEFKDFPLFAGNTSQPNQFSINLLENLANKTGVMPKIRVGGTTQDDAIFIENQTEPVITIGVASGTDRAGVTIGPSFFDSYGTFPATSYIAGINLATNGSDGVSTRQAEAEYISKALGDSLELFEIGNEPDLFIYWNRRASSWSVSDYVAEWENASRVIQSSLAQKEHKSAATQGYFAPSFAGTDTSGSSTSLGPYQAFEDGLDSGNNIQTLSGHNYMGSATGSGVSLQATLMNHSAVVKSISNHVKVAQELKKYSSSPYLMGETNSLSGGGASGLSNVFGAALWVVDYTLWQATQSFQRVHFHQSGTSPYSAWAPGTSPPTTNAPYYGNVAVASAVGSAGNTSIAYLDLGNGDDRTSAYELYDGTDLSRVVILNMVEWLSTSSKSRPSTTFSVSVPTTVTGASVERLTGPGADAISGITLGGVSYDYSEAEGKPVTVNATAASEEVKVTKAGTLSVVLQDSEGVVLHLF